MSNESLSRFCEFCEKLGRGGTFEDHPHLKRVEEYLSDKTAFYECMHCHQGWEWKIRDRDGILYAQ